MTVNRKIREVCGQACILAIMGLALGSPSSAQTTSYVSHSPVRAHFAPTQAEIEEMETAVVCLANEERARQGLPQLRPHPALVSAARQHSQEMNRLGYFDHLSPTAGYAMAWDRVAKTGFQTSFVAENIFDCDGYRLKELPKLVIRSFMASPGHRHNLLNERSAFQGVGIALQGDHFVVTQVFSGAEDVIGRSVSPRLCP